MRNSFLMFTVILIVGALIISMAFSQTATLHYSGLPKIDKIIYKSYEGMDPEFIVDDFIGGELDWIDGPLRYDLLEMVSPYGETCMNPSAEFSCILINCRDYKGNGRSNKPLNDSVFRLALSYIYGMDSKSNDIYRYIHGEWVYAIGNPVPPAQEPWYNESIQMPSTTSFETAWEILQDAGYSVDPLTKVLLNPDGTPVRDLLVWSGSCSLFWERGPAGGFVRNFNEFITYINATSPTMTFEYEDFITFVHELMVYRNFDFACMGLTNLGRFVDWMYNLLHSSNNVDWGWNFCGIEDPRFDKYTEIILTSLDPAEVEWAASKVQELFVNELMPWFPVSSSMRAVTVAHYAHPNGNLTNLIEMNNYGPNNAWTYMAVHWMGEPNVAWPGGTIKRALGDSPRINPYLSYDPSGWEILKSVKSELMAVAPLGGKPANLIDIPWIATSWELSHWMSIPELGITEGSMVTFYLRQDVLWHDLTPVTAYDCVENMLFLLKYKPEAYSNIWANLVYSEADGPYKFNVYFYNPSLYYAYYVAESALLLPKHLINKLEEWLETRVIENPVYWTPSTITYEDFTGDSPPEEYPFLKAIVGCGPYVFNYYDESLGVGELVRFNEFFVNAPVISAVIGEWGIDPDTAYEYEVLVQNILAKQATLEGELANVTVNIEIFEDDMFVNEIDNVFLTPFNFTYLGPFTTDVMPAGVHTITVEVYDAETTELIHTYEHTFVATLREDVTSYSGDNIDIKVDIRDVARAAVAFGSMPGHERWDPPCDVNDDFKVDIRDVAAIARLFGWTGTAE